MPDIPLGAVDRILRNSGASRVSIDASKELRAILEEFGFLIGQKSLDLAQNRGQLTIKKDDIRLAYNLIINKK